MRETERRSTASAVELREATEGSRTIGGYAAKFMRESQNLGGFVEQIDQRFFNKSAGDGWPGVMARYNHADLLATTQAESLRLAIDAEGLAYELDLLADSVSERVYQLVARGDVAHSSFAFITFEDDWTLNGQGVPLRTLISGRAIDVAPVDQPAYLDTSTGLRSLAEKRELELEEVRALASAGDLAKIIPTTPVVIDLGSRSSEKPGQAKATPAPSVQLLRRQLEMKQKAI